jgi:sulfatase maturation enzyme AslB (radical SAM superfamily)
MENTDNFCVFPWTHLFVDPVGSFYTCCLGPATPHQSRHHDGRGINASEKGAITKHWHSLSMMKIRSELLRGSKSEACLPCWRVEDSGGKSYRQIANETYTIGQQNPLDQQPAPSFQFVDLRFGNLCNLACRMCIPYSSKKLIPEYAEMFGEEAVAPYAKLDWFESPDFWEELFQYSSDLKKIHLAGGEPLLIKECWKFLKRLIDNGLSKNLILSYNTNLSVLPEEARELWPSFKEVHIMASMDGVGKVNDFIRYPLEWEVFEKNLKTLDQEREAYNVHHLEIHPTAQVYNIKRITEICDYIATNFKNMIPVPRFDIVYWPVEFDPQILPTFYREEAAKIIESYIKDLQAGRNNLTHSHRDQLIQNLKSLIYHLRGGDKSEHFHSFKRLNDIFDRHRSQRTFSFIPELERAYGSAP